MEKSNRSRACHFRRLGNYRLSAREDRSHQTHRPFTDFPRPGLACYFENAIEMLDEPGEWHLDRKTGVLSYWPRPGEDMATTEVVAPRLTSLLRISGTARNPVRNVHFRGIRFEYTDSIVPATGYVGWGGCTTLIDRQLPPQGRRISVEVAVVMDFSKSCSVEDCQLAHL